MTEYGSSAWVTKARERKSIRDAARKKFWATAGVTAKQKSCLIEAAPKAQRVGIVRLLQITRDGAIDDSELCAFLPDVARTLATYGLGIGAMGTVAENIDDLSKFHSDVLEHFFTLPYKF